MHRDLGYPAPRSLSRLRVMAADLRQLLRDAPRWAGPCARRSGWRLAGARRSPRPGRPAAGDARGEIAKVPSISVFVDTGEWDARAESLGGNSFSLVAAFAARVAEHLGRTGPLTATSR